MRCGSIRPMRARATTLARFSSDSATSRTRWLHTARCSITTPVSPRWLDTLAAAYAEAGRTEDAVATAETALRLASARRDAPLAAEIDQRLRLYREGRPFHWGEGAAR